MIRFHVARPECDRNDLSYVDSNFLKCGSVDLLIIYIYIYRVFHDFRA